MSQLPDLAKINAQWVLRLLIAVLIGGKLMDGTGEGGIMEMVQNFSMTQENMVLLLAAAAGLFIIFGGFTPDNGLITRIAAAAGVGAGLGVFGTDGGLAGDGAFTLANIIESFQEFLNSGEDLTLSALLGYFLLRGDDNRGAEAQGDNVRTVYVTRERSA